MSTTMFALYLLAFLTHRALQLIAASWLSADDVVVFYVTNQPWWTDVCSLACGQAHTKALHFARATGPRLSFVSVVS